MNEERLITSANWVRKELLIRLAHRIRDFQQLPFIVGANPHIEYVYKHYLESFESIRHFPPVVTEADNLKFCKLLKNLLEDGLLALPKLAQGLCESAKFYSADQDNLDLFLNRTLRSRISRRVLAEQHLTLTKACEDQWGHGDGYVGIIFVHCSAQQMIKRVKGLVYQHIQTYHKKETNSQKLLPPEIEVTIHPNGQDNEFVFAYVPEQLEYILYELLDNAVRFTMKKYSHTNYPPIKVTVSANDSNVYFRVSDQGGGITRNRYERIWSYQARAKVGDFNAFKAVEKIPVTINERANQASQMGSHRLGIGLTMSKIYAEYWGGELQMITMDGYGTDVYVRIPKLGTSIENLGIDLQAHPAFHNNDQSDLILKSKKYKLKHDDKARKVKPEKAKFINSSWSESCMIQS
ncbi:hypothetical protein G6F57_005262 [Rhizopus arrhizus]|uniref:Protein-serine/threonine kinase n=1 Tax=Rhizopus oryzae TaxID=64495 RepID=A0A9P6X8G1_RHIOR|nr:hypothetical protein G6F24_002216 [Rhizopus arrhizus]KAG1423657.1 hypothetical protein G6F58_002728 [Rhizopus delemar]KAG0943537.1 hypothetical protein G6F30_005189 [Rhizopus arrhizus]KAG0980007.1 hypothetical protein G6F29_008160 [Rhizopus arrhizus]KAG0992464.1 hypothetical protein G6F28_007612 [Rhizopus arrhizus]